MIPDGLITYTVSQLEHDAAFELHRRSDVEQTLPINVELLVENMVDVTLECREGLVHEHRCEGCVCKDAVMNRKISVLIDRVVMNGPLANYLAVVAEEFAHLKIHPALFHYVTSPQDFINLQQDPQWSRYEQDARRYSLAIRMPPKMVLAEIEDAYPRVVNEFGFGDAARASMLLRNEIAQRFCVPTKDAQRRLMNYPCDIQNRFLNSFQARSTVLLPENATVMESLPMQQLPLLFGN